VDNCTNLQLLKSICLSWCQYVVVEDMMKTVDAAWSLVFRTQTCSTQSKEPWHIPC